MNISLHKEIPPIPDFGVPAKIRVIDKRSADYEELASTPATVRIIRIGKEIRFVALFCSMCVEGVVRPEAVEDIVRRMKSENPTEDHDAVL